MFRSKLKQEVESLQWKVKSLDERNKELLVELEKALKTLRAQLLAVKNDKPISEEAILYGFPYDFISGNDLDRFLQENPQAVILDVRTLPEFSSGFIPAAKHIPVDQLIFRIEELSGDRNRPIITYCASGSRAQVACEALVDKGFRRVLTLKGGVGSYLGKLSIPERAKVSSTSQYENLQTDNADLANRVQDFLDREINPGVATHGGVVSLIAVQDEKVYLKFGGGCHGCGQVDVTLKLGITQRIQEVIAEVKEVIDVTDHARGENPYYQPAAHG